MIICGNVGLCRVLPEFDFWYKNKGEGEQIKSFAVRKKCRQS